MPTKAPSTKKAAPKAPEVEPTTDSKGTPVSDDLVRRFHGNAERAGRYVRAAQDTTPPSESMVTDGQAQRRQHSLDDGRTYVATGSEAREIGVPDGTLCTQGATVVVEELHPGSKAWVEVQRVPGARTKYVA